MRKPGLPLILRAVVLWVLILGAAACVTTSSRPTSAPAPAGEAAQYNLQLGISYLRQNNLQAARQKLEKALEQEPDLAIAHAALGIVFERLEDPKGAERHYRRAVDLDDSNPDNLNALAVFTCTRKQEPQAALKLFDRAIAIPLSVSAANRPMLYTNAGTCAKSVDLARSETYLRGALAEDPLFPDALLQLAEVTLERGNALAARGFLERYLARVKATSAALWLGVRIEQALNDNSAAARYGEQLRREFPEAAETRLLAEQSRSPG
ncbi:MAG: type IV pilus biogenesis/stability protein PilW [Chromatiales bacterium]|jgi:type IV pilus assembly protein PilF|nr:MAG: type IV pilus biogenesis/stability protein PilW [Chromatiales bacterium]